MAHPLSIDSVASRAQPLLMCNLYRTNSSAAEIARLFRVSAFATGNVPAEIFPGYPGLVVADGAVRIMHWGFPLATKGKSGQLLKPRPCNNARADKLTSPFWRSSFKERRCLIPVSAFAGTDGVPGFKTRSWVSVPGRPVFACAGIWRDSPEWGAAYSMVMTHAGPSMAGLHYRMPVILDQAGQDLWLHASPEDAQAVCEPYPGALLIDRTAEQWAGSPVGRAN